MFHVRIIKHKHSVWAEMQVFVILKVVVGTCIQLLESVPWHLHLVSWKILYVKLSFSGL
jgi:hypothetical protein